MKNAQTRKKVKTSELPTFDIVEHLDSEEAIADYLSIVLEENDAAAFAQALGSVARARGMADIAAKSGLTREALYRALRPNTQPRLDTLRRVCTALGLKLTIQPAKP